MTLQEEVLSFSREFCNNVKLQTKERKQKIASLYKQTFGKRMNEGCGTCYIEAVLEIKRFMEKKPCKYRLKAGIVRHPVFGDESKVFTNVTMTDELAELDIRLNPGAVKFYIIAPVIEVPEPEKELEIVPVESVKEVIESFETPVIEVKEPKIKKSGRPKK
jgi:hypothetical protein